VRSLTTLGISAAGSRSFLSHSSSEWLTPAKRLNFIGDALRNYLDPRSRIEAGL
jgi:hypothetical protein